MKNLTWQNPGQLFVAQELIKIVKLKCCGIKVIFFSTSCSVFFNSANIVPSGSINTFSGTVVEKARGCPIRSKSTNSYPFLVILSNEKLSPSFFFGKTRINLPWLSDFSLFFASSAFMIALGIYLEGLFFFARVFYISLLLNLGI